MSAGWGPRYHPFTPTLFSQWFCCNPGVFATQMRPIHERCGWLATACWERVIRLLACSFATTEVAQTLASALRLTPFCSFLHSDGTVGHSPESRGVARRLVLPSARGTEVPERPSFTASDDRRPTPTSNFLFAIPPSSPLTTGPFSPSARQLQGTRRGDCALVARAA